MLILIALVLALNFSLCIVGYFSTYLMHWGMLFSFIGSICMLFNSLARISKTIKSVKDAFPNEKFVWINVWNLVLFAILLVITYSTTLIEDYFKDENLQNHISEDESDSTRFFV